MEEAIKKLALMYVCAKLTGDRAPQAHPKYFEADGRKVGKIAKVLAAEGYIEGEPDEYGGYALTAKSYNEVTANKPDLIPYAFASVDQYKGSSTYRVHHNDIEKCIGALWDALPIGEKKWIVEHPTDYIAVSWNAGWGPVDAKRHQIGVSESFKTRTFGMNEHIYITDEAVEAERARRLYQNRYDYIRKNNLGWGLQKQRIVTDDESLKVFSQRDDGGVSLFADAAFMFGTNPEDWAQDIIRVKQALHNRIAADRKRLDVLEATDQRIAQKGGWTKFLEQYDQDVKAVVDKGTDEEE